MDIAIIQAFFVTYGLQMLLAVVYLLVGWWAAGFLTRTVKRSLSRLSIDHSIISFAEGITYFGVLTFGIVAALSQIGVQTSSIVAVLGAASLAIGLALQGSLSNFASGVLILLFKPFKVGDWVQISGADGFVESIQIFNTVVVTRDKRTITIPNNLVTSGNIINYSAQGYLRIDMVFGIGYGDDIRYAKQILQQIINDEPLILTAPPPSIAVLELGDSSVNFAVRPFVQVDDYMKVKFAITEQVKLRFDEAGISIPFPQRDVHLYQKPQ